MEKSSVTDYCRIIAFLVLRSDPRSSKPLHFQHILYLVFLLLSAYLCAVNGKPDTENDQTLIFSNPIKHKGTHLV